jgi:hypothetical protein
MNHGHAVSRREALKPHDTSRSALPEALRKQVAPGRWVSRMIELRLARADEPATMKAMQRSHATQIFSASKSLQHDAFSILQSTSTTPVSIAPHEASETIC